MLRSKARLGAAVWGVVLLARAGEALACGGFFCAQVLVQQNAEQILFAKEADGSVTTYVQIRYSGSAESFAWLVPVAGTPELSVGTDAMFNALDIATRPSFPKTYSVEGTCRTPPECRYQKGYPPSYSGDVFSSTDAAASADAFTTVPGVRVESREAVGPYDAVVLDATNTQALQEWLTLNHYDVPQRAIPLMEYYVQKHNRFVAIKLLNNHSVQELQPLVLHTPNGEPCVPIKLTAIATAPRLAVQVYVLGEGRAQSLNYDTLELTYEDAKWYERPWMYNEFMQEELDSRGGHVFVTESVDRPPTLSLGLEDLSSLRRAESPFAFFRAAAQLGLRGDTLFAGIVASYLPAPEGQTSRDFLNCIATNGCPEEQTYIASLNFQAHVVVDELEAKLAVPRREAEALLRRHHTLSRLITYLPPERMDLDPIFDIQQGLPDYASEHPAKEVSMCSEHYLQWDAPRELRFPSGRVTLSYPGFNADISNEAYCSLRGGPAVSPPSGCSVQAPGTKQSWPWGLAFALGAVALGWRRWRNEGEH